MYNSGYLRLYGEIKEHGLQIVCQWRGQYGPATKESPQEETNSPPPHPQRKHEARFYVDSSFSRATIGSPRALIKSLISQVTLSRARPIPRNQNGTTKGKPLSKSQEIITNGLKFHLGS